MRVFAYVLPFALSFVVAHPVPVQAQTARTFALPAGCTGYLTVQMKSCTVSHHFTCDADPDGWQRRVDMDDMGVSYFGAIDAESQWVESFHTYTGHTEKLADAPVDPASFTELTSTGTDGYDFQTLSEEIGTSHYAGRDTLTGQTVTIDGVVLEQTQFEITATDSGGGMIWQSAGFEFINRDWRMFLSGRSTITTPDDSFESDDSPMEFVFPEEVGFLSVDPKFGCSTVTAGLISTAPILPVGYGVTE